VSQETHREDDTILAALEALEAEAGVPSGPRGDETAETLTRLYTEALGLLPYELPPAVPRPEVKARLLASLQRPAEAAPAPAPAPAPTPAPAPAPPRASQEVPVPRSAVARGPSRWPLALAAALALLFLGLSIWLYTGLVQQNETIARLTLEVEEARRQAAQAVAQARDSGSRLEEMRERLALVTSPAVEVSPMRPVGEIQPRARGILFVAADHQHWYLSLDGLQPAGPGKTYKLWFIAEQGTVGAGTFTAEPGAPVELSSEHMPARTRGAVVTLEDDAQVAAPTGPEVLRAAGVYQVS
jgi:hypothetical protein